jgi:cytochrome c-type biogenesis protein CcmF
MIPVLVLMAAGPFVRWKESSIKQLLVRLRWLGLAAVGVSLGLGLLLAGSWKVMLGLGCAAWVLLATVSHLWQRLRHAPPGTPLPVRLAREPRSYWGMLAAHAGIGVFVIGVTLAKGYDEAVDASMRVGDATSAGGYSFRLLGLRQVEGPNYVAVRGSFEVSRGGSHVATMQPERRIYTVQQMPMTEAAIERGFTRDLYVSLGEETSDGRWLVRVQHKPFIGWIWAGCLMVAGGGLLAASDRRYRPARRARVAGQPDPGTVSGVAPAVGRPGASVP